MHNLYLLILCVFSIFLFLYGFFPIKYCDGLFATKDDLPMSIEDIAFDAPSIYIPVYDRLILMVIDALRVDFVDGIDGLVNMPYTSSAITNQRACKVTGKADAPTVTMPRIKALTSGTVPNFVDLLFNLGSTEMLEDNVLNQATRQNWKMVFYGDNTWLKLFPEKFIRSDGTSSFFVSDFEEVDNNVTRHLAGELTAADWKIMVLHYLGLDHIGHYEGPKSSYVRPKLQEMDNIVKKIHIKLKETDEASGKRSLFIVCADHGMKDTGSHGGASQAEVLVPIVVMGHTCSKQSFSNLNNDDEIVSQIDLAPTLSVLLGLPIPAGNLGKMIPQFLNQLTPARQLYALHYNAKQVSKQYARNNVPGTTSECLRAYNEAVAMHAKWLRSGMPETLFLESATLYMAALKGMSSELTEAFVTFDVYAMSYVIVLLCQILIALLLKTQQPLKEQNNTIKHLALILAVSFCVVLLNILFCTLSQCNSVLCQTTAFSLSLVVLAACVFIYNSHLIWRSCYMSQQVFFSFNLSSWFLVLGSIAQVASLASSSFIEEEHQVWYFLWISFTLILLYNLICSGKAELAWQWFFVLSMHRLLRKWNQTGDKWAALPDIGDWLKQHEQKYQLSFILLIGVAGIFASCEFVNAQCRSLNQPKRFRYRILWALAAFYVYCFRGATGVVYMPFNYPQSRGIVEVHIFWCILAILLFLGVVLPIYQLKTGVEKCDPLHTLHEVVGCILITWMFMSAVLHRPHDVILLPVQVLVSGSALRVLSHHSSINSAMSMTLVNVWLGFVFYYYQGNSNSLASIDVGSGYVGQEEYSAVKVGLLLLVNTYSAHVLSHLLVVMALIQSTDIRKFVAQLNEMNRTVVIMRVFLLAVYTLLVTLQRYHLFVWTVFSPKLLYESMHTLVTLLFMLTLELLFNIILGVQYQKLWNQIK